MICRTKPLLRLCMALLLCIALSASTQAQEVEFQKLDGLFEPSGVLQLGERRLLVIEDEPTHPFSVLSFSQNGVGVQVNALRARSMLEPAALSISDLEGVTFGSDGFVYAITSHSRTGKGKRDSDRERLIRFAVVDNLLHDFSVRNDLRDALGEAYPRLESALKERDVKDEGGFNIEGLTFGFQGQCLWIGLRAPLIDDKAILIGLLNPQRALEDDEDFRFSEQLVLLDLDRGGIRDIVFDTQLGGYLIVSNRENAKKKKAFKLWLWSGEEGATPKRVRIDGINDLERTEGITSMTVDGKHSLVLMSDDGNRRKRKSASYLRVDYDRLEFENQPVQLKPTAGWCG